MKSRSKTGRVVIVHAANHSSDGVAVDKTRKLKIALHVCNGLASPADAACRMYCEIYEVIRYVAAPV